MTQQLTDKSDVYSFGLVMLERVTSKLPIEKGKYIGLALKRDREHYGLTELIDPVIRSSNLIGFERFVDLALQCVEEESANRPRMNELVKEIEIQLMNEGSNPTSASSSATPLCIMTNLQERIQAVMLSKTVLDTHLKTTSSLRWKSFCFSSNSLV